MGQSSSRASRPLQTPQSNNQEQSSTAFPTSSSNTSPVEAPISRIRHTSDISGSRRSSVRKSILNLVKPSTIRSRVTSVASSPGDLTRSWRNSRRWSRVPVNNPSPFEEAEPSSSTSGVLPIAGPSTLDKGKQPERHFPLEEEIEEELSYHEAPEEPQPQLACNQSFTDIDEDSETPCTDSDPVASSDPLPDLNYGALPTMSAESQPSLPSEPFTTGLPPQATPRQHTASLPPRQFPPPGTLVIVQGVVHTTDISRTAAQHEVPSHSTTNNPDVPDEPGRSRARNRLSALLRPQSSSRRSSMAFNEAATTVDSSASPDTDGSRSLSEDTVLTTPSIDERLDSSQEPLSTPAPHNQESASTPNNPPSISSSSIDVLGTLLSVAAAATAASLLTGSSEPILSSGLAPTPSSTPTAVSPTSTISEPNLRTPPDASAASRAERMRQAWGTIRERLGLRPSAPDSQPPPEDATGRAIRTAEDRSTSTTTDARELMLAEMARAFNIGLGLNGINGEPTSAPGDQADSEAVGGSNTAESSGSTTESTAPPPAADPPQPPLPPEGSFERFLVDLQIDLRNALTHVEDVDAEHNNLRAQSQPTEPQPSHTEALSRSAQPEESLSLPAQPHDPSSPSAVDPSIAAELVDVPSNTTDESEGALDDSDSEHGDEIDDDYDDEDFHSVDYEPSRTATGQQPNDRSGPSSGMGRIDAAGRINWWRLYRFPAISSSSTDQLPRTRQTAPQGLSSSTQIPLTGHSSMAPSLPEAPSTPILPTETSQNPVLTQETSSSQPAVSPSSPSPRPLPIRSVVPVIIVGLQSVNSQWRPDMPMQPENEGVDILGQAGDNSTSDAARINPTDDADLDWGGASDPGFEAAEGGTQGQERSRGWHSRAADALRNLRPGRRNAEAGAAGTQGSPGSNGSRTFLIYVIGGYYPPDHNIVTGGPANFDSFEALLELADLLGQVKPPTASKDDIKNSGLEVVKASQLTKFFDDGKVTANCLDRCLICLDDYESEDDLRLLKCRHAFHQQCVDHWMQTGRNNCPACRSTGVSTEPRASSESVAA